MKSSFIDRIRRRNEKAKNLAEINKQKLAKSAGEAKQEQQQKETVLESKKIVKDPETLILN